MPRSGYTEESAVAMFATPATKSMPMVATPVTQSMQFGKARTSTQASAVSQMEMQPRLRAQSAASHSAQMQAYSPFNAKKYETLSYLPELRNEEIFKQVQYMIKNRWTPALEFTDDGDIYLNTRMGPGYYDNRYWSMYKLPMFGCTDPNEVLREIETCRRDYPMAKIRVIAFDPIKQVQTAGFIVKK